ncbi:hypothetical protein [uncultured Polaribacter sp.]|uniref:hypothetical protein n=1 Tax=uncultured Polaribacter sp. TaxID=174711 RepID=UPI00260A8492|nr:hypothetical protein [uncultured Polaribacter sp.]
MIVFILGFYGYALFLAATRPNQFVLFYILASTKFLGFLDPALFLFGRFEIGYFGINLIAIFTLFFKRKWYEVPQKSQIMLFLAVITLLYGILKPILSTHSTAFQALLASKDIWFFAILFYLMVYFDEIKSTKIVNTVIYIGIYFSILYCVHLVLPQITPPVYNQGAHLRTFFPTYISLGLFFQAVKIKQSETVQVSSIIIILLLALGLILATHFSLTLMTFFACLLYFFAFDKNLDFKKETITKLVITSLVGFSLVLFFVNGLYQSLVDTINGIIYSEDLALSTRDIYNKFRWDAIEKSKYIGYGFIHQSSALMNQVKLSGTSAFMERFTVIDSGYVDLLIKYGYVGTTVSLLVLYRFYFLGFVKKYRNAVTLAMSLYMSQYLFINYTWSVFSFAHGIIPSSIAFYIIIVYKDEVFNDEIIIEDEN